MDTPVNRYNLQYKLHYLCNAIPYRRFVMHRSVFTRRPIALASAGGARISDLGTYHNTPLTSIRDIDLFHGGPCEWGLEEKMVG